MATFPFEIVAPERLVYSGEVQAVTLPGAEGEFQVMANHAPLLALLGPGFMQIEGGDAAESRLFIDGGFCDMNGRSCTVLAEAATPISEMSAARLDEMIAEAEEAAAPLEASARDDAERRIASLRAVRAGL